MPTGGWKLPRVITMPTSTRNQLALGLLVLAKALGIAGLVLGARHRLGGGLLLALDGVLLVAAVVISIRGMKQASDEEDADKAVLARMVEQGTLDQYLRDLRAAGASRPAKGQPKVVAVEDAAAAE